MLYRLWSEGNTIEKASAITGIPRSTTGYYYKKFDRYAKRGEPIPVGAGNQGSQARRNIQALKDVELKRKIEKLEAEGKHSDVKIILDNEKVKRGLGLDRDPIREALYPEMDPQVRRYMDFMEFNDLIRRNQTASQPSNNSNAAPASSQANKPTGTSNAVPAIPSDYEIRIKIMRDKKGLVTRDKEGRIIPKTIRLTPRFEAEAVDKERSKVSGANNSESSKDEMVIRVDILKGATLEMMASLGRNLSSALEDLGIWDPKAPMP